MAPPCVAVGSVQHAAGKTVPDIGQRDIHCECSGNSVAGDQAQKTEPRAEGNRGSPQGPPAGLGVWGARRSSARTLATFGKDSLISRAVSRCREATVLTNYPYTKIFWSTVVHLQRARPEFGRHLARLLVIQILLGGKNDDRIRRLGRRLCRRAKWPTISVSNQPRPNFVCEWLP